jgi:hypothetical protein
MCWWKLSLTRLISDSPVHRSLERNNARHTDEDFDEAAEHDLSEEAKIEFSVLREVLLPLVLPFLCRRCHNQCCIACVLIKLCVDCRDHSRHLQPPWPGLPSSLLNPRTQVRCNAGMRVCSRPCMLQQLNNTFPP